MLQGGARNPSEKMKWWDPSGNCYNPIEAGAHLVEAIAQTTQMSPSLFAKTG